MAEAISLVSPRLRTLAALALFILAAIFIEPLLHFTGTALDTWLEPLRTAAISAALFIGAFLVHDIATAHLTRRRKGRRPVPKVVLDLVRVLLYAAATLVSLSLVFSQGFSGILAGSGILLAVLGFAIRNVVADTFSGLAFGIEAPFRIGDWVRIETLAEGRVQEIGWRTTRLVTRDSTYVILPNSQISRQRITNFSAPRQEYRDHIELTLPVELSVAEADELIRHALADAETISEGKLPEAQVMRFAPEGITYRVRYWVPQHDRQAACRSEMFTLIDRTLREKGIPLGRHAPTPAHADPGMPELHVASG